jgi:protein-arginine kinase activator protein McsA
MKKLKMRKQSSNGRLLGAAGGSRANLLNRELTEHDITAMHDECEDFINPDEFEEIAEIYDSLRILHSRQYPDRDT